MHRAWMVGLILVVFTSGCAERSDPVDSSGGAPPSEPSPAVEALARPGWHIVNHGSIIVEVPARWELVAGAPCGEAIVAPPEGRASCPPLPSVLIDRREADSLRRGRSPQHVVTHDLVVRVSGVAPAVARRILASVRQTSAAAPTG